MDSLTEVYNDYLQRAHLVKDWETLSKSELCRKYIEYENTPEADNYISAIIVRYWSKIPRFFKDTPLVSTMYDCYCWLITSIQYALEKREWENPKAAIYNDPNGPDKVINRCMKCERINFIVAANRDKRKALINIASKDKLDEDMSGNIDYEEQSGQVADTSVEDEMQIRATVKQLFTKKLYFLMFLYDCIINLDCFEQGQLSLQKVVKELKKHDDKYIRIMSERYEIDYSDMLICFEKSIKDRPISYLMDGVAVSMNTLKKLYFDSEI